MRLLPVIGAIALASVLMCAHPASAFTIYSGGGSGGSSRYADPDNQFRSYFGLGGASSTIGATIAGLCRRRA